MILSASKIVGDADGKEENLHMSSLGFDFRLRRIQASSVKQESLAPATVP